MTVFPSIPTSSQLSGPAAGRVETSMKKVDGKKRVKRKLELGGGPSV